MLVVATKMSFIFHQVVNKQPYHEQSKKCCKIQWRET